jgi:hypothetical protein
MILTRATWDVSFKGKFRSPPSDVRATAESTMESDAIRVCRTRGEAIRVRIERTRKQHARVRCAFLYPCSTTRALSNADRHRANIIAQAYPSKDAADTEEPWSTDLLDEEAAAALLRKLQSPWIRHKSHSTGHGPKRIGETYTNFLPTGQRRPIRPTLRRLVEATKALEHYNEYARQQLRKLDEEKQRLDVSGMSNDKMPAVSTRFPPSRPTAITIHQTPTTPITPIIPMMPSIAPSVAPALPPAGRDQMPADLRGGSVIDRSRDPRLRGRTEG